MHRKGLKKAETTKKKWISDLKVTFLVRQGDRAIKINIWLRSDHLLFWCNNCISGNFIIIYYFIILPNELVWEIWPLPL